MFLKDLEGGGGGFPVFLLPVQSSHIIIRDQY